jgi:ferric iron reductase protein FhuF
MHDVTVWAAWYLFLLAIPVVLVGSMVRDRMARRHGSRRGSPH